MWNTLSYSTLKMDIYFMKCSGLREIRNYYMLHLSWLQYRIRVSYPVQIQNVYLCKFLCHIPCGDGRNGNCRTLALPAEAIISSLQILIFVILYAFIMFLHTGIFTLLVQNFCFQVFTSIALLNMLIAPLNAFPWVLNGLTEAWVSLKRIQRLLEVRIVCARLITYNLYLSFRAS